MPAGLRHVTGVAIVVSLLALAAPVGALADGGGKCKASACQVYTEGAPTAGTHTGPPKSGQSPPGSTKPKPTKPAQSKTARLLAHAGKDKAALARIISDPNYGAVQELHGAGAATVAGPSFLGAAFSLGLGPTLLLVLMLATGIALALRGGVRDWRRKRD